MANYPETNNTQKTILVADDKAASLALVAEFLTDGNFKVLASSSGDEALRQSRDSSPRFTLFLCEFEMSDVAGIDLATKLMRERPAMQVLLMTDFPKGMLILNDGWNFLLSRSSHRNFAHWSVN